MSETKDYLMSETWMMDLYIRALEAEIYHNASEAKKEKIRTEERETSFKDILLMKLKLTVEECHEKIQRLIEYKGLDTFISDMPPDPIALHPQQTTYLVRRKGSIEIQEMLGGFAIRAECYDDNGMIRGMNFLCSDNMFKDCPTAPILMSEICQLLCHKYIEMRIKGLKNDVQS